MKLVASSNPSLVDRFEAIGLLTQRSVLTRLVCSELANRTDGRVNRWRADTALSFLVTWIASLPDSGSYPRPSSGIETMIVPDDCGALADEIRDGALVCDALAMLQTADTDSEWRSDMTQLDEALAAYMEKHPTPALPPALRST